MRFSAIVSGIILTVMTTPSGQPQPDLRTRAEITRYEETSSYADVQRVINGLVSSSPLVHTEAFGKTEEGRELPLLVISEPKVTTPEAARKLGRPLVFVQANIHAGEVEGKEAMLVLARRLIAGHPVGGLQLPGLQGPRGCDRRLRRRDLEVGCGQREADHVTDRASRPPVDGAD